MIITDDRPSFPSNIEAVTGDLNRVLRLANSNMFSDFERLSWSPTQLQLSWRLSWNYVEGKESRSKSLSLCEWVRYMSMLISPVTTSMVLGKEGWSSVLIIILSIVPLQPWSWVTTPRCDRSQGNCRSSFSWFYINIYLFLIFMWHPVPALDCSLHNAFPSFYLFYCHSSLLLSSSTSYPLFLLFFQQ